MPCLRCPPDPRPPSGRERFATTVTLDAASRPDLLLAYSFLVEQRLADERQAAGPSSTAAQRPSLPAVRRAIVTWLLQDLLRWWVDTDRMSAFQPRRL